MPGAPAVNPSLVGTMVAPEQQQILSQIQAALQQMGADAEAKRMQAQTAATQAGQQYQQAAQAPPPELSPMDTFVPTLMSGVASVLTQDPGYKLRAHERIKEQRKELLNARSQHLLSLRDSYAKLAERADQLGDEESKAKHLAKTETLNKTLDVVMKQQEQQAISDRAKGEREAMLEATRLRGEYGLKEAQIRANAAKGAGSIGVGPDQVNPDDYMEQTESGIPYFNQKKVPDRKVSQLLTNHFRKQKVAVVGEREQNALDLVREARDNAQSIEATILPELPATAGERIIKGPMNVAASLAQTNPVLSGYPAIRTAAINIIQAIAGLGKGLRINQAEIQAALKYDVPRITDTQDVALQKLGLLRMMLNHVEMAAVGATPPPDEVKRVIGSPRNANVAPATGGSKRWIMVNGELVEAR